MRDGVARQTQRPFHPAKAASRVPASLRPCVNPVSLDSYDQLILHAGEIGNTGHPLGLFPTP
jgi:hypothetical protein